MLSFLENPKTIYFIFQAMSKTTGYALFFLRVALKNVFPSMTG
jgi:hypothetical protein